MRGLALVNFALVASMVEGFVVAPTVQGRYHSQRLERVCRFAPPQAQLPDQNRSDARRTRWPEKGVDLFRFVQVRTMFVHPEETSRFVVPFRAHVQEGHLLQRESAQQQHARLDQRRPPRCSCQQV